MTEDILYDVVVVVNKYDDPYCYQQDEHVLLTKDKNKAVEKAKTYPIYASSDSTNEIGYNPIIKCLSYSEISNSYEEVEYWYIDKSQLFPEDSDYYEKNQQFIDYANSDNMEPLVIEFHTNAKLCDGTIIHDTFFVEVTKIIRETNPNWNIYNNNPYSFIFKFTYNGKQIQLQHRSEPNIYDARHWCLEKLWEDAMNFEICNPNFYV